ncbi:hypothetical protein H9L13_05035 [Sphingomonas lutea]|uniref:Uncharacterized protein n=1 Tax=Sphingomonas lutea TaxID=1045317 RepID=A0A7G9SK67_9SPHN|nr:hypothetical protein [Sphingomonas lutea]QNN68242.1 hypothetical protein H9L13_05035 [Sphingomonas lutea]
MPEDEHKIGSAYQTWLMPVYVAAPFAVANWVEDTRWLIALGVAGGLAMLHEIGGRLYDLCIRLRRTNILLAERAK